MSSFEPEILFEDQDLLVLQKPAGIVVNEAESAANQTIQAWARSQLVTWEVPQSNWQKLVPEQFSAEFGSPSEIFDKRAGMVHRLDKETSGVLIWAKNPGSLVALMEQFQLRQVKKSYTALVHGVVTPLSGEITAPIGRVPWQKSKFGVMPGGRSARTIYEVVSEYHLDEDKLLAAAKAHKMFAGRSKTKVAEQLVDYFAYTLVTCWPKTGRTHQIRVHFQHLHHPLAGDSLYQGNKRIKLDSLWCPRHFLHAKSITLRHPRTQLMVNWDSDLPLDLVTALGWMSSSKSIE